MLWLYLHFPLMMTDHYRARGQTGPIALTRGTPPVIDETDHHALEAGVHPGQSLATARGLCPDLTLIPFDDQLRQRILERIASVLYRSLSPLTLWPTDGLVTRADRLQRLYGDISNLMEQIAGEVSGLGFHYRLGTGTSPRMARLLARHQGFCSNDNNVLEKRMRALPVTATDWPESVQRRLIQMGLRTLGDLLGCCSSELASRLGPEVQQDLRRITGQSPEPLSEFHPPESFRRRAELDQESSDTGSLEEPLRHLFGNLEDFLRQHQVACERIRMTLHHPDAPDTVLEMRTAESEYRSDAFLELALLHLNASTLVDRVRALSVEADQLTARRVDDDDLFANNRGRTEALAALLHRLRARLGPDSIQQPGLHCDPRPEKVLRWHRSATRQDTARQWPVRPVWLQEPPLTLRESPGQWLNGPERIQGGWWDGHYVRRDYYIAVLAGGRRAWLYRNERNLWFIHGWFG